MGREALLELADRLELVLITCTVFRSKVMFAPQYAALLAYVSGGLGNSVFAPVCNDAALEREQKPTENLHEVMEILLYYLIKAVLLAYSLLGFKFHIIRSILLSAFRTEQSHMHCLNCRSNAC